MHAGTGLSIEHPLKLQEIIYNLIRKLDEFAEKGGSSRTDLRQLGIDQVEVPSVVIQLHAIPCDDALIHQVSQLRLIRQEPSRWIIVLRRILRASSALKCTLNMAQKALLLE